MEPISGTFRSALRKRLLDDMIRKVKPGGNNWKVLVVDREALRILLAAVQFSELVNEGITIVEILDLRREPLPRLPAIYFITPSVESIDFFVKEQKSQYMEFHLFFTSRLPDFQVNIIRRNQALLRRVKTFIELNISFMALESRVFSLDRPAASLPQLFGTSGGLHDSDAVSEMSLVSERLTDACTLVGGDLSWSVHSDASSHVSRTVASLVKEQLVSLEMERLNRPPPAGDEPEENESTPDNAPKKATLIVLDRATDVISPLMHEFTYQPMLHDLLHLNYRKPGGAHYTFGEGKDGEPKELPIDDEDKDPVWQYVRHLFIETAHDRAKEALRHFLQTDAAYKIIGKEKGDVDIADLSNAIYTLPESQMRADRHAMHVSALHECLQLCRNLKLTEIASIEQDLAIGRQPDGDRVSSKQVMEQLRELLADNTIPIEHRVRTLLIAIAIAAEDNVWMGGESSLLTTSLAFKSKMAESGLDSIRALSMELRAAIEGLRMLLNITKSSSTPADNAGRDSLSSQVRNKLKERKEYKQRDKESRSRRARQQLDNANEVPYDVARYIPPIRSILADLVSDRLDSEMFPVTGAVRVNDIISDVLKQNDPMPPPAPSGTAGPSRPLLERAAATGQAFSGALRALKKSGSEDFELDEDAMPRNADPDHLYVVFFVGGVCYSEIRTVYEVCKKRNANIIVGGSHILTPSMFLSSLGGISDAAIKIRVTLPPLPLDLALMRAAKEKTLRELKAAEAEEEKTKREEEEKMKRDEEKTKREAARKVRKQSASRPTSSDSQKSKSDGSKTKNAGGSKSKPRPADGEPVVVETYKKPSRMNKWFGKKN